MFTFLWACIQPFLTYLFNQIVCKGAYKQEQMFSLHVTESQKIPSVVHWSEKDFGGPEP